MNRTELAGVAAHADGEGDSAIRCGWSGSWGYDKHGHCDGGAQAAGGRIVFVRTTRRR